MILPGLLTQLTDFNVVAEHLKRPLYRMGAGDLGSIISTVESRLSDTLLRCAAWNAVLLIDEADVFLESRTTDSLERNELISSKSTLSCSIFVANKRVH
jgi:hypothetical protein|tara:strand:+ start:4923 stop:5219 length:297 start_codon:yes stop_codon:yes gene_type:complete